MTRDVLHIIQENMTGFSKGQRRIAGYILSDYDKAAFMTANKLGAVVGVSESTVVQRSWDMMVTLPCRRPFRRSCAAS